MSKIGKLADIGENISGVAIVLMSALILVEIIFRAITGASTMICEEYSAYLLVVFAAMAFAYGFKSDGHIRVDLILSKLPPRGKTVVDLACTIVAFVVFGYVVVQTWGQFYGSWESGETSMYSSRTPLWIPQIWLVVGTAIATLQLLSMVATLVHRLGHTGGEDKLNSSLEGALNGGK